MTRRPRGDAGSTSVELAVLTPMVLLVLGLMIAGGRVVTAHAALDHVATAAARAASLARTATTAQATATSTATQVLEEQDLSCTSQTVTVDTSGFAHPLGQAGHTSAAVSCSVPLADLFLVPGLPGAVPLHTEFTSPLDPFRGRT